MSDVSAWERVWLCLRHQREFVEALQGPKQIRAGALKWSDELVDALREVGACGKDPEVRYE